MPTRNAHDEWNDKGGQSAAQKQKPIKAIIVGAGHRSMLYASYSVDHPGELQIAGVVDPDEVRRTARWRNTGFRLNAAMCRSSS